MLDIRAQALGSRVGEVLLYGDIVDTGWERLAEEDTTPQMFNGALKSLGGVEELRVRINCYGGSVFAGRAMGAMLDTAKQAGTKVVTVIEGVAASMAAALFQYGDERVMWDGTLMMNHKPLAGQRGNADDHRKVADILDKAEESLLKVYMRHFTGTEEELRTLLRAEDWLTAEEALACGLCSAIEGSVQLAAHAGGFAFGGVTVPQAYFGACAGKVKALKTEGGVKGMFDDETKAKIEGLLDAGGQAVICKLEHGFKVSALPADREEAERGFLSDAQVRETLGEQVDAETLLNAAKQLRGAGYDLAAVAGGRAAIAAAGDATQPDPAVLGKAVAYDLLVDKARERALANGVKAKGESFDKARWGKVLDSLTLDEVEAMGAEWAAEAAEKLHAGTRRSVVPQNAAPSPVVNPDDYKL